jgi:hypothetical protein
VAGSVASVVGNVGGNVAGSVGSVVAAVTAGTVLDKGGYSLVATTGLGNQTANITGNLSGSVGSVTGAVGSVASGVTVTTNNDKSGYSLTQAFPTNFSSLVISTSGVASANVTQWNGSTLPTIPTAGENADAVWDEPMSGHTTAGTYGGRLPRSFNSNVEVQITGSRHIAADIHELQPAVITAADFDLGAIDANALAADAAAEVASAVRANLATELGRIDATASSRASQTSVDTLTTYVDTEVAAIKAKTDNLPANPAAVGDIPTAIAIADMVLSRSVASVESSAAEHTLCTLVLAALEGAVSGNTWTIRRTNGSTTHYTKTVTSDANAAPIVSVQ